MYWLTVHWLSGKLWHLQHNCIGDTIVYHWTSDFKDLRLPFRSSSISTSQGSNQYWLALCGEFFWGNINTVCVSIYILYCSSTLTPHMLLRFIIQENKNLLISHSQYHGCWWPGDNRSQGINSHGIDLVSWEYSRLCITRIKHNRGDP